MKSIYPLHGNFSIADLDQAIQAVVSTGSVGISFLNPKWDRWPWIIPLHHRNLNRGYVSVTDQ